MTEPHDWTDDEIDALLRESVGELEPDRFDEMVRVAVEEPQDQVADDADTDAPGIGGRVVAPMQTPSRWSNAGTTRWLAAAAVVVVAGLGVVVVSQGDSGGGGDEFARPRGSTAADTPPTLGSSAGPPPPQRPVDDGCDAVKGGEPAVPSDAAPISPRKFRCTVALPSPTNALIVLVDDARLIGGAAPPPEGSAVCVDARSRSADAMLTPGACDGSGLGITVATPGTYTIEYRLRTCLAPGPDAVPGACGPPESEFTGRIVVDVE